MSLFKIFKLKDLLTIEHIVNDHINLYSNETNDIKKIQLFNQIIKDYNKAKKLNRIFYNDINNGTLLGREARTKLTFVISDLSNFINKKKEDITELLENNQNINNRLKNKLNKFFESFN